MEPERNGFTYRMCIANRRHFPLTNHQVLTLFHPRRQVCPRGSKRQTPTCVATHRPVHQSRRTTVQNQRRYFHTMFAISTDLWNKKLRNIINITTSRHNRLFSRDRKIRILSKHCTKQNAGVILNRIQHPKRTSFLNYSPITSYTSASPASPNTSVSSSSECLGLRISHFEMLSNDHASHTTSAEEVLLTAFTIVRGRNWMLSTGLTVFSYPVWERWTNLNSKPTTGSV